MSRLQFVRESDGELHNVSEFEHDVNSDELASGVNHRSADPNLRNVEVAAAALALDSRRSRAVSDYDSKGNRMEIESIGQDYGGRNNINVITPINRPNCK